MIHELFSSKLLVILLMYNTGYDTQQEKELLAALSCLVTYKMYNK